MLSCCRGQVTKRILAWLRSPVTRKARGSEVKTQRGFTLVEVLVAVAVLGIISVPFFSALGSAHKAVSLTDERETASNMAKMQMESVKSQAYLASYNPDPVPSQYTGYSAGIVTENINSRDGKIQKITITIQHNGDTVTTLEGYKVLR
jgi:prepilin-type N-terminal cleavage/methylation domain-containing protein